MWSGTRVWWQTKVIFEFEELKPHDKVAPRCQEPAGGVYRVRQVGPALAADDAIID